MTQEPQYYPPEASMVDYVKVIYKHIKLIIALVLVAMFSAGVFSLLKPKMYEASAAFFPLNTSSSMQAEGITIKPSLDSLCDQGRCGCKGLDSVLLNNDK
jgi:uncharacterized protein involved in exopolysaccharide biosynthesis